VAVVEDIEKLQDQLFRLVEREIDAGNFEKAIEIAAGCYFLSKGYGAKLEGIATTQMFAAFMASLKLENGSPEPRCSFCGRGGDGVRLGAGPKAYICDECVSIFAEQFNSEPKKKA
jgi:hypothetical protein